MTGVDTAENGEFKVRWFLIGMEGGEFLRKFSKLREVCFSLLRSIA